MKRRVRAGIILIAGVVAFSGCAPEGIENTSAPNASVARSATPDPTTETSPDLSPAPSSSAPMEPLAAMTSEQAATTCARLHTEGVPSVTIDGPARVEARPVEPEWLVLFPASNANGAANVVCILGGDPADPEIVVVAETIPLTEEEIERDRTSNAQYES